MSIVRKNWSALSSLTRQWTVEDEEEVEREKRRRVKSSVGDPDDDLSQTRRETPANDSPFGTDSTSDMSQGLSSVEELQLDFVEMLHARDEKRRMRHMEALRRQKEEGENEAEGSIGGGGARVELLGDLDEEQGSVLPFVKATSEPQPPTTASYSHSSSSSSTNNINKQHENRELPSKDPDPRSPSNPARKFVSSVSISLDKSPTVSGSTTPMSPCSPTAPLSPRENWSSPYENPSPTGAQSPVHSGPRQRTRENGSSSSCTFEQTAKPAFVRQSSRTLSFRMIKKKEEESSPLQRSASVRMTTKTSGSNTDQNEDEDNTSPFLRNSRQRISSRSIQEKMERLAQAAQKSEIIRSPDVAQRTLFLLDEVSRKRGIFEKEQQAVTPTSPGISRQEFRSFTSGMSDRINRWINKTNQTGSSHNPTELRHVDISGKRSLFENKGKASASKASAGKTFK
uniref:ladinin-1 n=1 Tax=Monopterus albus TaxID=43700 RepID=UPI0009B369AC|nr:ladinin-1 [Monopterus albus]